MIIKKVDKFLKLISQSSFWDIKTTILTFLLIQFVSFPSYRLDYENWGDQYEKSVNIFSNIEYGSGLSHKAKMNLRITVPIIIKILGFLIATLATDNNCLSPEERFPPLSRNGV